MNPNRGRAGRGALTETYYPKALARFCPKKNTLSLKTLAEEAVIKVLVQSELFHGARNCRMKKGLRRYLNEWIPLQIQTEMLDNATRKWFGSDRILKLMDLFEPSRLCLDKIDMIGSFRYAYGCYFNDNKLFWSNGTIERLNLSQAQCDKLKTYLEGCTPGVIDKFENVYEMKKQESNIYHSTPHSLVVRTLAISTERQALKNSVLPSMFTRLPNLVSITLLNGATNHILRIFGMYCTGLKELDVSHSNGVSDYGISGLLLKKAKARFPSYQSLVHNLARPPLNRCARTLCRIVLIGTEVSINALNCTCAILKTGYYVSFLPDIMIVKPAGDSSQYNVAELPRAQQFGTGNPDPDTRDKVLQGFDLIAARFVDRRRLWRLANPQFAFSEEQVIDSFEVRAQDGSLAGKHFLRSSNSHLAEAVIHTKLTGTFFRITELILSWDSFTWSVTSLPDLTELGVTLPFLKVLKARVQGIWDKEEPLFPHLTETYVWTVSDETLISFMRSCTKIETFKFNCLDLVRSPVILTDEVLKETMASNPALVNSLTEICIRPAAHLHMTSAQFLLSRCPNLKRLGDMESWRVSAEEIKTLNERLDQTNSGCVLTVLSFPPKEEHEYLV